MKKYLTERAREGIRGLTKIATLCVLCLLSFVMCSAAYAASDRGQTTSAGRHGAKVAHLSKRGVGGAIAVRGRNAQFPGNAGVSFARTRSDAAKRGIMSGLSRRRGRGVRGAERPLRSNLAAGAGC